MMSPMEPVYTPVLGLARTVFLVQGLKFTITGTEHVPRTGGAVMALNHISYMDFVYGGLAARPAKRLVRFMAKREIFEHRIAGPLMRNMKHISVDRGRGAASYAAALRALRAGEVVGLFPEETISVSFEIKGFKTGAARLAQDADVPIVPVVIWGSQRVWTKRVPRRMGRTKTPIRIVVGAPLRPHDGETAEELTDRLRTVMIGLLAQAQADYPPMPPELLHLQPARLGGTAPTPEEAAVREAQDRAAWKVRAAEATARRS